MKHRTLDEMISYFNQEVSEMDIKHVYKIKLLGMIAAIGYEAQKHKWIPCSERLPEKAGKYLVTAKPTYSHSKEIMKAYWSGGRWPGYCQRQILAWMPLPEPYKAAEDDRE